jgi:hypothetical protein
MTDETLGSSPHAISKREIDESAEPHEKNPNLERDYWMLAQLLIDLYTDQHQTDEG